MSGISSADVDEQAQTTVAVCGATGRQGRAVTRALLADGSHVRALTRDPSGKAAAALATAGAEVVRADMDDRATLVAVFTGADAVFSVQNGLASGFDREVAQGRNVADAAADGGVGHLVYASAGPGAAGTGVPSWEAKIGVEKHLRETAVPFTILRPMAFMELMSDPGFYPAVAVWRLMPKLMGEDRPVPWASVDDVGVVVAKVLARSAEFTGRDIALASDVRTIGECRADHERITGKTPRTFPMPTFLFDRFTKGDLTAMWRWLRDGEVPLDTEPMRTLHPEALSVAQWLEHRTSSRPG